MSEVCPTCNKEFTRLDLHVCKTETDNSETKLNIRKERKESENTSKKWEYYGMDAWLLYFWTTNHSLNAELVSINSIKPEIDISNFEEMFRLNQPAFFISGKPVFVVKRGYPISINLEFISDKERSKITEKFNITSDEFYSLMKSSYKNQIFKNTLSSKEFIIIFFMGIFCTALLCCVIFLNIPVQTNTIKEIVYIYNQTAQILGLIPYFR